MLALLPCRHFNSMQQQSMWDRWFRHQMNYAAQIWLPLPLPLPLPLLLWSMPSWRPLRTAHLQLQLSLACLSGRLAGAGQQGGKEGWGGAGRNRQQQSPHVRLHPAVQWQTAHWVFANIAILGWGAMSAFCC
jgi:hypothetical protein